jgi:hypothetical protein
MSAFPIQKGKKCIFSVTTRFVVAVKTELKNSSIPVLAPKRKVKKSIPRKEDYDLTDIFFSSYLRLFTMGSRNQICSCTRIESFPLSSGSSRSVTITLGERTSECIAQKWRTFPGVQIGCDYSRPSKTTIRTTRTSKMNVHNVQPRFQGAGARRPGGRPGTSPYPVFNLNGALATRRLG